MSLRLWTIALEFVLFAGVVLWGGATGPERMALHWGFGGEPDRIGSRERWVVETAIIGLALLLLVGLVVLLAKKVPVSLMNIPNKDYWAKPENTSRARALLLDDVVDIFGDAVLLVTALELIAVLRARSGELDFPMSWFLGLVALFFLSVGWRLFKLPGRYAPR